MPLVGVLVPRVPKRLTPTLALRQVMHLLPLPSPLVAVVAAAVVTKRAPTLRLLLRPSTVAVVAGAAVAPKSHPTATTTLTIFRLVAEGAGAAAVVVAVGAVVVEAAVVAVTSASTKPRR